MTPLSVLGLWAALLAMVNADGLYTKKSPVLQVSARDYDRLIAQSNHASVRLVIHQLNSVLTLGAGCRVGDIPTPPLTPPPNPLTQLSNRFYAPWCGHCQKLKPAYEKAAENLAGLAKVAAVNCDEEDNKAFCGQMGIQGFPTLKIVKPESRKGRPSVEEYRGARTAKGIVDAVLEKIPNHVKRLQADTLDDWLAENPDRPKALLFSEKGTTSAVTKALAIDFLGGIDFAQIRDKESEAVERFGVLAFPSLILIPSPKQEPIRYEGEMKKPSLVSFLSQAASPNPDPPPKKPQADSSSKSAKSGPKASAAFSRASASHQSADFEDYLNAGTIVLDDNTPTDSPIPVFNAHAEKQPIHFPDVVEPIPTLSTASELADACLTPHSGNCLLVLLPAAVDSRVGSETPETVLPASSSMALSALAAIAHKHTKRKAKIFPFYAIPASNTAATTVRADLGLKPASDLEIIALNAKRGWWRPYNSASVEMASLEAFVDSIKLGEGTKERRTLPGIFINLGTDKDDETVAVNAEDAEAATATSIETDEPSEPASETPAKSTRPVEQDSAAAEAEPEPASAETPVATSSTFSSPRHGEL